MTTFVSPRLAPLLIEGVSPARRAIRAGLLGLALVMIVAALLGPRWGIYVEPQKVYGVDVVVALDVSRSMLAEDLQPTRLERAKKELRVQLAERAVFRRANRLALLAFAGGTSLRLPLTSDTLAFAAKLADVQVGSVPRGGTSLASAIERAVDLFSRSPQEATKVLLLVTDGEDHEGGAADAARRAQTDHGIRVHTVGVGDPAGTVGAQLFVGENGARKPLLHDGQIVFSRLDVPGLQRVAAEGHGSYAPMQDLHVLVNAIADQWKTHLTTEQRQRHRPRYQWFVVAALTFLTLETLVREQASARRTAPRRLWQQELA